MERELPNSQRLAVDQLKIALKWHSFTGCGKTLTALGLKECAFQPRCKLCRNNADSEAAEKLSRGADISLGG